MNVAELVDARVAVLFTTDTSGDLTGLNEPGGKAPPLVYLCRSDAGVLVRFAASTTVPLREDVRAFASALPAFVPGVQHDRAAEDLQDLVANHVPPASAWQGPAFTFPLAFLPAVGAMPLLPADATRLHPALAAWEPDLTISQPCLAVFRERLAVALCCSARSSISMSEAGVETVEQFRGQGCGVLAVRAWSAAVHESGRTPLYSTSWQNAASLGLARHLELEQFAEDIHVAAPASA